MTRKRKRHSPEQGRKGVLPVRQKALSIPEQYRDCSLEDSPIWPELLSGKTFQFRYKSMEERRLLHSP